MKNVAANVHNWITPTPNQRPRDPPSSVKKAVTDGDGKKTSVNVTVWSNVRSIIVESKSVIVGLWEFFTSEIKAPNIWSQISYENIG